MGDYTCEPHLNNEPLSHLFLSSLEPDIFDSNDYQIVIDHPMINDV